MLTLDKTGKNLEELISVLIQLKTSTENAIKIVQNVNTAMDPKPVKGKRTDTCMHPGINVQIPTSHRKRLLDFMEERNTNRKELLDSFVKWCKAQPLESLAESVEKSMRRSPLKHPKAKLQVFYTEMNTSSYRFIHKLADKLTEILGQNVTACNVFRGLIFKYIDSISA